MAKILTGNRTIGRPGFKSTHVRFPKSAGKLSVRRLFRRDPAKGILGAGGDAISFTEDIVGPNNPRILSRNRNRQIKNPQGVGTSKKKFVSNQGPNRSLDKR
jgi:hypothetical protein